MSLDSLNNIPLEKTQILAQVAMLSPPFLTLSYSLPEVFPLNTWQQGQRVVLPLGNGVRIGLILELSQHTEPENTEDSTPEESTAENKAEDQAAEAQNPDFCGMTNPTNTKAAKATKAVKGNKAKKSKKKELVFKKLIWPLDKKPFLPAPYLKMLSQLSARLMSKPGQILASILPLGLRSTQLKLSVFMGQKPKKYALKELATFDAETYRSLAELWLAGQGGIIDRTLNQLENEICSLTSDPPWGVRPSASRQIALLELLWEKGPLNRKIIQNELGAEAGEAIKRLSELALLKIKPANLAENEPDEIEKIWESVPQNNEPLEFELTEQQLAVVSSLKQDLLLDSDSHHLLHGITGSGKTIIYLELIKECLAQGRSVILLAPEVALAIKLRNDLNQRFPQQKLILFHGYQSPNAREAAFRKVSEAQEPLLLVGTRSTLFLPVAKLGLIILDEEHDASFKQDEGLNYQAKELAYSLAQEHKALLLLGSATPDIKSFQATKTGTVCLHSLDERVGGGTLPSVELVDIRHLGPTDGLLSQISKDALIETVTRGEQAVILLNRRGYSPLMYCMGCGGAVKCPSCEIALTYHKARERLICHYCGYNHAFPAPCPSCQSFNFVPFGEGTEKLEESLASLLPFGCKVLRLDRDSARRPGRMEEILASFARKEAQVLVGTQMLSKGHHFPDVTLAIVADADLGLNLPDYRATERSFQLLVQSAGRAGRGEKAGRVLIQTRNLDHYCWDYVRSGDFNGFFEVELQKRKRMSYPPFSRLGLIRLSYPMEWEDGRSAVEAIAELCKEEATKLGVTMLGPAPAPMGMLRGRRRFHCLLKSKDWQSIRLVFLAGAQSTPFADKLRMTLDLDPVNMM